MSTVSASISVVTLIHNSFKGNRFIFLQLNNYFIIAGYPNREI